MADRNEEVLLGGSNESVTIQNGNHTYYNLVTNATSSNNETNVTTNLVGPPPSAYLLWQQVAISTAFGVLIIGTILGNTLVCTAVALTKKLQSPSNLLIVSLAVSDLLVAALVMPLGAVYEVLGYWVLNEWLCDLWTSLDVIMCTASILNLCMISIDRYLVITRPFKYATKRTPKLMGLMVASVWCLSVIISVPPLFGWRAERQPYMCSISQAIGYQIYATIGAFYIPLIVMIIIYFKIWRISSRLMKKDRSKFASMDTGYDTVNSSARSSEQSENSLCLNGTLRNGFSNNNDSLMEIIPKRAPSQRRFTIRTLLSRSSRKSKSSVASSEGRATKTLGIIMGGFTLCWLPFFILAVIRPFLDPSAIPIWLSSCLAWLGYFNSFLNPIIYARFNREFRTPFKEIACCRCHDINRRVRSESYVEQYGPVHVYRDRDRDSMRLKNGHIERHPCHDHLTVQIENGHTDIRESIV